jgi:cytidine deaminase
VAGEPVPGTGETYAAEPGSRHTVPPGPEHIDWEALRAKAIEVMHRAYAPYSRFPVGVAGVVDDGRLVVGCNVENAAYGVGLCAECGLVSHLHASGGGRLVAVACVGLDGEPLMPCGRCRQLLWENGGADCEVLTPLGVLPMRDLLPQAFGPENLDIAGGTPV